MQEHGNGSMTSSHKACTLLSQRESFKLYVVCIGHVPVIIIKDPGMMDYIVKMAGRIITYCYYNFRCNRVLLELFISEHSCGILGAL